jgi:hypothetical protein
LPQPECNEKGEIFCPLLNDHRTPKPEEIVRQSFILHLNQHYGYTFEQMAQEKKVQHGRRSPRADIVVWESAEAKANGKTPAIVVECKAEAVNIHPRDYYQGESYARAVACEIFITHNQRQTANTDVGRMHFFRNAKTTSGLGTINSTEVRIAPLPLPDKKLQAAVVRDLERAAEKAHSLRETAAKQRAAAWNDFISAIFT